ncbi:MAG: hypothetical protein HUJ97_03200 [Bacteroidales bacterium]|nr:hypothetical protein [Bacteroidales bacterium]
MFFFSDCRAAMGEKFSFAPIFDPPKQLLKTKVAIADPQLLKNIFFLGLPRGDERKNKIFKDFRSAKGGIKRKSCK